MRTGKLAKRYNPVRLLGQGAMGVVWLVEDLVERTNMALKVVAPVAPTRESANLDPAANDFVDRDTRLDDVRRLLNESMTGEDASQNLPPLSLLQFKQEFRLMVQLRHPNCCEVYDYGVLANGTPFFTMEFVEGNGLDELLPLDQESFRRILTQLLVAVGHVHQLGLVHCDIKPANVRVRSDGLVKLMDFGLMEHAGRSGGPIKGTLAYLAPEIVRRGTIDQRADLYAVGCLAYEMWTGQPPFRANRSLELIRAHIEQRPVAPARVRPGLDPVLDRIILRLLEKDTIHRYQSAHEVLADLDRAGLWDAGQAGGTNRAQLLASPMLGREAEQAWLGEALTQAMETRVRQAVLLWGSSGVGKSRLLQDFRFRAQLENVPVAMVACSEYDQAPYSPFVSALRHLLPSLKSHARQALDIHGPVLTKLLPNLAYTPVPDLEPPLAERMRLQASLAEVFLALAKVRGVALIFDNWQHADALSTEVMAYLLRNVGDASFCLLIGMQELPGTADWLEHVETRELTGVAPDAIRTMIRTKLGTEDVHDAFVEQITEFSEGKPYYVEMMLEHLVTTSVLTMARGTWRTDVNLTPEVLPKGIAGVLTEKLRRLSPSAQVVAKMASAVRHRFTLALLKKLSGFDDDELLEAIAALESLNVIIQTEDGSYAFARDMVQSLLYNSLEPAERNSYHTAIALALEWDAVLGTPAQGGKVRKLALSEVPLGALSAITEQYLRANVAEKTIMFALESGKRHARLYDNHAALRFLDAGLALLDIRTEPRWDLVRLDYHTVLGDVKRMMGRFEAAMESYMIALPIAQVHQDGPTAGQLLTSIAKMHQVRQRFDEAIAACTQALQLAEGSSDSAAASRALATAGRVRYFMGDIPGSIADLERALNFARASRDAIRIGAALGFLGYLLVMGENGRRQEGFKCLQEAVSLAQASGDRISMSNALELLGLALRNGGSYQEAREHFERKVKISYESGVKDDESSGLVNLAQTVLELGDLPKAYEHAHSAVQLARQTGSKMPQGMALILEAAAAAHMGRVLDSLALAQEALGIATELKNKHLSIEVLTWYLDIMLMHGNLAESAQRLQELDLMLDGSGDTGMMALVAVMRAELALRNQDYGAALAGITQAIAQAEKAESQGVKLKAWITRTRIAIAKEDWLTAQALAQGAQTLSNRLGTRCRSAEIELLLGEIALASGQKALQHFTTALELAEAIHAPMLRAEALFGLAACAPYAPVSDEQAKKGSQVLQSLVSSLDEVAAADFVAVPTRKRVLEGNFVGFSLSRNKTPRARTGPLGGGMWNGQML